MLRPDNDDLGKPISPRQQGFSGRKIKPLILNVNRGAKKEQENIPFLEKESSYPIYLQVAGTKSGPKICEACGKKVGQKATLCMYCQSPYLANERQVLLKEIWDLRLGIAKLVVEPENDFDSKAVAVYVRWPKGDYKQIGYLPAKTNPESGVNVIAADFFDQLIKDKKFWVECRVVGGPQEGRSDINYGLRLTINDKPPA